MPKTWSVKETPFPTENVPAGFTKNMGRFQGERLNAFKKTSMAHY